MLGRTNTGGGGGLNYKVVGNPQPASASENTIWIDTGEKITGHYFTATQPEDMKPGEVWFSTGTVSSVAFSVSKKNTVMIYPLNAMQMVDGVLVAVEAKSWQGGRWVKWWTNELYTPGDEWEAVTGGWTGTAMKSSSGSSADAAAPVITRGTDTITAIAPNGGGVFHTAKKIDLRNFSRITFSGNFTRGGSTGTNLMCACWEEFGQYYSTNYAAATKLEKTSGTEITVDISNVNTRCYVGIGLVASSEAEITSILLS